MNIKLTKLKFHLIAKDQIYLPKFSGSTLRGGFGHALRRACCTMQRGQECSDCMLKTLCVYASVFETSCAHVSGKGYNLSDYPRLFIIEPPFFSRNRFMPGESFSCNLVLMGKAVEFLPYFVFAFMEMGNSGIGAGRGRYRIDRVTDFHGDNDSVIFDGTAERFTETGPNIETLPEPLYGKAGTRILLNFKTPTRIKTGNHLTAELDFRLFMQNLFRRLSLLTFVVTGSLPDLDYKKLLENASEVGCSESDLSWYDWKRYSGRQKNTMKLGGFVGTVMFEGEIGEFMPFVKAGESIHIGKACTFGLGKYEILET